MKSIAIRLIKGYQNIISPSLGKNCRFLPSCSEYAILAIKKYGTLKGIFLAAKRILKCHPLNPGGVDFP